MRRRGRRGDVPTEQARSPPACASVVAPVRRKQCATPEMTSAITALPERFTSVDELEAFLTQPSPDLCADLAAVDGDILILGVGGKMGPTLARLARHAAPQRESSGWHGSAS